MNIQIGHMEMENNGNLDRKEIMQDYPRFVLSGEKCEAMK